MKKLYNVYQFEWQVELASAEYEQGKENKAFRILNRALRHFDEDIPAYVYYRYYDMWKDFEEEYEVDYDIVKMTDDELNESIEEALRDNRNEKRLSESFQKGARRFFKQYLNGDISSKSLHDKLYVLEKQKLSNSIYTDSFEDETIAIFRAYFYGRETISYEVAQIYKPFLCNLFACETYESVLKKRINKKIEDDQNWPKAIKYAIKPYDNDGRWTYIYADPSIPSDITLANRNRTEGKNMLAFFNSLIRIEYGERSTYLFHNGCKVISNWHTLMEEYPKLAEQFVIIGNRYFKAREDYIRKVKLEQERKILDIPVSEREKIVQIWNHLDIQMIKVVD